MPTLSMSNWPTPKSWEEFEELMWDLLRSEWRDPNATRNGRQGQLQDGVDIYGQRDADGPCIGVQCKLHGRSARVTLAEINNEVRKAEQFNPPLKEFVIATTATRDARLQQAVRLLSEKRQELGRFKVFVRFWDDIEPRIALDIDVAKRHYPEFFHHTISHLSIEQSHNLSPTCLQGKLQLFVSSRIKRGVSRERLAVVSALEDTAMAKAWYWERDGYAADGGYQTVCSHHAQSSDGLVLILGRDISPNVLAEYMVARASSRPCFVMVKDGCRQDARLRQFLEDEWPHITIRRFRNISELRTHVINAFSMEAAHSWRTSRSLGYPTSGQGSSAPSGGNL